jgi:hypothetical protein
MLLGEVEGAATPYVLCGVRPFADEPAWCIGVWLARTFWGISCIEICNPEVPISNGGNVCYLTLKEDSL